MIPLVQKDAIGFQFICELGSDVSSASVKYVYFKKPTGAVVQKTASFLTDGTDGRIYYATIVGDLDTQGIWSFQAYVELGSGFKGRSLIKQFNVAGNL